MNPIVTDHAVERYLERVRGHDVAAIKVAMLSEDPKVRASIAETRSQISKRCAAAVAMGARCIRADGVKYEFNMLGHVVSVVPGTVMPSRTSRKQSRQTMRSMERARA